MTLSDQVRDLFSRSYVSAARANGHSRVQVAVRDLNRELSWADRYPLICGALTAPMFHEELGVELVSVTDPCPSSTTILTFSVLG